MANGPGGTEVGRVSVRVLPDSSRFAPDLQAYLDRLEKSLEVQIPVSLDAATLGAELEAARKKVEAAVKPIRIGVEIDSKSVETAAKKATAGSRGVKLPVSLDDAFARRLVADVRKLALDAEVDIPITVDGEALRRELFESVKTAAEGLSADVPIDLEDATEFRRKVLAEVAKVEALTRTIHPTVDVDAELNRVFAARIKAQVARAAREAEATIPLSVDGESLRRDLATAVARVDELLAIDVPIDVTDAAELRAKVAAAVAEVEGFIGRQHPQIELDLALNDAFAARIKAQVAKLAREAEANIPVTVDGEDIRRRLAAAVLGIGQLLEVEVPITLEGAAAFRAEVIGALAEVEALAKSVHPTVEVDVDVDSKGLITRKLAGIGGAFVKLFGGLDKLLGLTNKFTALQRVFGQIVFLVARFAAVATLVGPPLLLAAAGAAALAPALALSLPILGAVIGSVAVLGLGIKAITDGKLPGSRDNQPFAVLKTQVDQLSVSLGLLLTAGIEPVVKAISVQAFPVFARGLEQIARVVNQVGRTFAGFATSTEFLSRSSLIFSDISRSMATLGEAIVPVSRALQQITVASLPGLQLLAEFLRDVGVRFSNLIDRAAESGTLTRVITQATKDLIGFVSALGRISGEFIDLLVTLEPASRAVFSAISGAVSSVVNGLNNAIKGFTVGDSIFLPLIQGIATVLGAARALPGQVIDALQPLLRSTQFREFAGNLGVIAKDIGLILITVSQAAIDVLKAFNQTFGVAILATLNVFLDALAGLGDFLVRHKQLAIALSTVFLAQYVPAILTATASTVAFSASIAGPLILSMGRLALAVGTVVIALAQVALGSLAALPALLLRVSTAGLISAGALATLKGAALAVSGAIRGLAASLLTLTGVATAGVLLALAALAVGLFNIRSASEAGREGVRAIVDGLNVLDTSKTQQALADLQKAQSDALRSGKELQKGYEGVFGTFKAGFDVIFRGAPLSKFTGQADEATKQLSRLRTESFNVNTNLSAVAETTGVAYETLRQLASAKGIDLSKVFAESGPERAQLIADLQAVQTETGLTAVALSKAVGPTKEAWDKLAKAIKPAVDATNQAFKAATDVIANFDPQSASDKIAKATDKVTKAQQALDDTVVRVASHKNKTVSDQLAIANAQRRVVEAQADAAKIKAAVGAVTLEQQYRDTLKLATDFTNGIAELTARGLDPAVVSKLLQAGPEKAAPALQALLADHSGKLIELANQTETKLAQINATVVEQARLTNIALNAQSDIYTRDLANAMLIAQTIAAAGGKATAESLARSLKIPVDEVNRIASEFGITIQTGVQAAIDKQPPIRVTVNGKLVVLSGDISFNDVPVKVGNGPNIARAYGGLVAGAGTSRSDSIHALLSHGEFVHQVPAVNYYGRDVMAALNSRVLDRDVLRALLGRQTGLGAKLAAKSLRAASSPVASAARPAAIPAAVIARPVHRQVESEPWGRSESTPLVLVDADGRMVGHMRAVSAKDHRSRQQSRRLAALGDWGPRR